MKVVLTIISLFAFATCVNAQHLAKRANTSIVTSQHKISSVKRDGDSLSINQMVIVQDQNLASFISDFRKSRMVLGTSIKTIPSIIKDFLSSFSTDKFSIANPGKNWNCCDGGWDENLPNRELINIGADGHLFMITYLKGGIGTSEHIILIRYTTMEVIDFWVGDIPNRIKSKVEIIRYLKYEKNKHRSLNKDRILI